MCLFTISLHEKYLPRVRFEIEFTVFTIGLFTEPSRVGFHLAPSPFAAPSYSISRGWSATASHWKVTRGALLECVVKEGTERRT